MAGINRVAPYTGAWIETLLALTSKPLDESHPTRVRGLKLATTYTQVGEPASHPTRVRGLKPEARHIQTPILCRTLHGCVD